MRRNLIMTILGVVLLTLTVSLLLWIRWRLVDQAESSLALAARSFDLETLGDPSDLLVDFEEAEARAAMVELNPFIQRLVLTKVVADAKGETRIAPVVPYDLRARMGEDWVNGPTLAGMTPIALEADGVRFGELYIEPDTSALRTIETAIVAVAVALAGALILLLGQLYRQQSTIQRVGLELERRKHELIRLERLALAGELTANLLHDLKKPVLSVRQRMQDWLDDSPPEKAGEMEDLLDESGRDLKLFFQMLTDSGLERFVRSDRVSEEYVDVNQTLETSLKLVHYERGDVEVRRDLADDLPPVLVQPFRLVQVFSNLVLNAYQALKGVEGAELHIGSAMEGGRIVVTIEDNGPGISDDLQASIFEPFFTTKGESEGSGLGLAISRLIVEEMGGEIALESREGGPTRFRISLPAEA